MSDFRAGRRNLLFATEVLEEGIDVPQCALVVLFDLKRNVRSYIQARGRARHAASRIVVLVSEGAPPRRSRLLPRPALRQPPRQPHYWHHPPAAPLATAAAAA